MTGRLEGPWHSSSSGPAARAEVTVRTACGCLSAWKKSAERRCLSRCLFLVLSELASKLIRPVTVPSGLTVASPVMRSRVPRTVMTPQKCLTRNSARDCAGSSTQLPAAVPSASCDVMPVVMDSDMAAASFL